MTVKKTLMAAAGIIIVIFLSSCQRAVPGISEECQYQDLYTLDRPSQKRRIGTSSAVGPTNLDCIITALSA
ncbi:MAG: hypothetical protein GF421_03545 [Candidatus Aminicenantes bacterium]|nr:hypothetical protein [Candidatus Aminicenantes bacterium]